ncbi:Sister chromatid cohesion protein pds5 [Vermiconidia calcicola]|uniref:Sister chromatid cohesion protein pds5 n=1 Tax=Vermiconidia calcicola TaxID=1690605 RepID=A0ACC3MQI6_9PEZI|nr:Sister chromatid cohesion protein pds5 [Vermiconidia calcicola]
MARGRNKAPSPEPMEVEDDEEQEVAHDEAQPLQFNEPITWRPGKAIAVSELLRRLETLCEELTSMSQEDADRETLVPKAQELASPQLMEHKDKGVKASALLCIMEMFRLLAPNAPYKKGQLKQIFTLFTSTTVPALANPSDPYNQQNSTILASMNDNKIIALLADLPGCDYVILNLVTNCFDVMAGGGKGSTGEKLPKNLEYHMTGMLCTLLDELGNVPSGVVDIILAQFLRADPTAVSSGGKKGESKSSQVVLELPPAYNMARSVCNTCSENMVRAIGQYFSSVLIDASETFATVKASKSRGRKRTHDESEDGSDDDLLTPPAESDLHEVEKAHRLLRELWRSSPDIVQNVIPQVEAEIEAESTPLRTMAVQTVGDMISGIGAAGPPPAPLLDPAAYPSQSLDDYIPAPQDQNVLLTPNAPLAFSSVYPAAYHKFIDRYKDKAPQVRSAWASEAGRIILTSGGGKGLDEEQEKTLLLHLAKMLQDTDERVRLAAVQTIAHFDFPSIIQKLGKSGSVLTSGSVLSHLADRIKDRKHHVRVAAVELLGRIWGVAAGAISEGNERTRDLVGGIPSKIFDAYYINEREVNALVQRVLFDSLLPVTYPPIKPRQPSNSDSQRVNDSQSAMDTLPDPDAIRAERILVLVRDLDQKARLIFFNMQTKQFSFAKYLVAYLKLCEDFNGGATEENAKETKKKLDRIIEVIAKACDSVADPLVAAEHLKKFAKQHDRRSYQLIRFCHSPESDFRKVLKATKELTKRLEDSPSAMSRVLDTMLPLVRSTAVLVYNKSHVPAIVSISRTDEKGLGTAAHVVLKEISAKAPDVFKVHVHELCETLKKQTPSATTAADPAVVDTLKACAGFARRFPEGMPKGRDFYKAMIAYCIHGTPPKAAKHAVTVIVSSADKKEMYIRGIQKACIKSFTYGDEGFLSKLASISQLRLLAIKECEDQSDAIMDIAANQVLGEIREPADGSEKQWSDEIDEDLSAKLWALRILVNSLRGFNANDAEDPGKELKEVADPVYKLLNTLIKEDGELSKSGSTPQNHKAHLRLAAAAQLLKLSCNRTFDPLLTQNDFNQLSKVAQDEVPEVRAGFVKALKKYLGNGMLGNRFYGLVLLYAFEPQKAVKDSTITWLKSRAAMSAKQKDNMMEASFPRFMSLLAHHQDFSTETAHLEDFVEYIMFYLKNVATEATLPLIYHFAQRLKMVQDGIDPEKSENLYVLSDIAEAAIRYFQEIQGWSLQVMSSKAGLPSGLFSKLPSHAIAQEIADKRCIPEELADELEDLVKNSMKTKKRRSDGSSNQATKKPKPSTTSTSTKRLPVRRAPKQVKTPRKKAEDAIPSSDRRKSTRASSARNYAEHDDSEDDEELEHWQQDNDEDANKENVESCTPPTSDPTPAPILDKTDAQRRKKPTQASKTTTPQKSSRRAPARNTRATRGNEEKDIMDVPSDSE